jgi:hypothetical protein
MEIQKFKLCGEKKEKDRPKLNDNELHVNDESRIKVSSNKLDQSLVWFREESSRGPDDEVVFS